MRKLLVTGDFDIGEGVFPDSVELLHIRCPVDEQQIMDILPGVHDYILGGPEYLSARLIDIATKLEHVVVMGTGTSSFVDVEYAKKKGIRLSNTPYMNAHVVTEFTLAMITVSLARIFESIEGVKEGSRWLQTPRRSLSSLGIGFVGMGAIGTEIAQQLQKRGCKDLHYWSRTRKLELEASLNLKYSSLIRMVAEVDILCVHIAGGSETRHLIDEVVLKRANPKLMIFNMSSPGIICPVALKGYLQSNTGASCFIDGYYNEWTDNKGHCHDVHGLLSLPTTNLVATSHLAGQEQQTVKNIFTCAVIKVLEFASDHKN